jgi:hypothetical protein
MRMTQIQAQALARFLEPVRTDWDFHGVLAALKALECSWQDAAVIAVSCAADPTAKTPAAMRNPVYAPAPPQIAMRPDRDPAYLRMLAEDEAARAIAAPPERIAAIRAEFGMPPRKVIA